MMNWDEVFWQIGKQPYKMAFTDERCYGFNSQVLTGKKQGMRTQKQQIHHCSDTIDYTKDLDAQMLFTGYTEIMNQVCLPKCAYPMEMYYSVWDH